MNRRRIFTALIFLIILTACVLPGFSTPTPSQPTPTVDLAGPIETMVAATVSAAVIQTEQSVPRTFTETIIIVTAESSPTPMPTSTPMVDSTLTATPTVESQSQSTLTRQDDSSFLFVDDRAGYEIKLPSGWLAVRVQEKEYIEAFSLREAASGDITQSLLSIQTDNPNVLRLFTIDPQPSHIQNEFVSDMRFVLDGGKTIALNSDADLQAIAAKIPASATVFRFEVTSVKLFTSASGVQFGVIETKSSFTNNAGVDVPLYQKQVFFNTKGGIQSITLTTLADLKDILLPAFDAMLETINLK